MKMYGMKIMVFGDEFITIDNIYKFVTSYDSLKYFDITLQHAMKVRINRNISTILSRFVESN